MDDPQSAKNIKQQLPGAIPDPGIENVTPVPNAVPNQPDGFFAGRIPLIPEPAPFAPLLVKDVTVADKAPKRKSAARKFSIGKAVAAISALLFLILLAGGGVFAYNYFFPSPEAVIQKITAVMSRVETMEYGGKIGVSEENNNFAFGFNISGATDLRDAQKLKNSCAIKIASNPIFEKGATVGVMAIGKTAYFRMNANNSDYDSLFGNIFNGQWIKIDRENFIAEMRRMYPQVADTLEKEAAKNAPLTAEQIGKLRVLAENSRIMTVDKNLGDESVDGVDCRHYAVKIDKDALQKFIKDEENILKNDTPQPDAGAATVAVSNFDFSGIEIWAAENDFTLRRIKGSVDAKYGFSDLGQISFGADFDINFQKINQPVLIIAPEKSTPLEDVFKNLIIAPVPAAVSAINVN